MGFFKKKEEKKKFDYSEETKELFAERDAFYAEQRQRMGGNESNPELANKDKPEVSTSREKDVENLLEGGGDFNPYVNNDDSSFTNVESVAAPISASSSSAFVCTSCGKDFQEKWGKCPSCGGEMKKAESAPSQPESNQPSQPAPNQSVPDNSAGDPLDDLLGDFGSSDAPTTPTEQSSDEVSSIRMVNTDDLTSNFGESRSKHSNRKKTRKVKKIKRARKVP